MSQVAKLKSVKYLQKYCKCILRSAILKFQKLKKYILSLEIADRKLKSVKYLEINYKI